MYSMLDKLRFIESDAVPGENAVIETLSTSVKITHRCGCILVRHFAADRPLSAVSVRPDMAKELQARRENHIAFCPAHQKAFDEFVKQADTRKGL